MIKCIASCVLIKAQKKKCHVTYKSKQCPCTFLVKGSERFCVIGGI